ncbi:hypothetical protein Ari01nite_75510 [Paractinoplanes rishiriensis]|uniref:Aminoglycoside phosphotransferase domain-containing protein n=1 Tax=Paractinoplanes rishiriensis TaxID=1050105 RepID=A0A919MU87_9ACTN|nr:hypothetical protein Ari01nite_75510 [Actinoplanes rishiriensis]
MEIVSRVLGELGVEAVAAEPVAGSVGNETFRVRVAGGADVFVKTGPREMLRAEWWACRRARAAGLPAPEITARQFDGESAYLLLVLIPGAPSESREVWREAGRAMRIVHDIPVTGYGRLVVRGDDARGTFASWAEARDDILAAVPSLVDAAVLPSALASAAVAACAGLRFDGPGVLLHRDLKPLHIFGQGTRLTGLLDWGDAGAGDPLFDLARLSMAPAPLVREFFAGYGLTRTPELDETLRRYRILFNLEVLAYEYRAGGDWFEAYRRNLRSDLAIGT